MITNLTVGAHQNWRHSNIDKRGSCGERAAEHSESAREGSALVRRQIPYRLVEDERVQ